MVSLRAHLRKAARKRWAQASEQERKENAARASRAFWNALSPEERSTEMKRRAAKRRRKNKAGKKRKRP